MTPLRSLVAACAAILLSGTAAAAEKPPFPRLAGYNIGSPHNFENPAYQAKLAKLDFSILSIWPGWEEARGVKFEQIVRDIKALNPDTKVFLYHISMELNEHDLDVRRAAHSTVSKMRWWTYTEGTNGSQVKSSYGERMGQPIFVTNTTLHTPRDGAGHQFWEWDTRYLVDNFFKPNPSLDGFFEDNVFWKPRVDADWNRDGNMDGKNSAQSAKWLREGYRSRFELLNSLMPGKYQLGNIADWGLKEAVITEYRQMLHGGVIEGILGNSYSPESWSGWDEMMRWYRKSMDAVAEPKLVVFHQQGKSTDYQALRYGLASCLMDDGYFGFYDYHKKAYGDVVWFDEFDVNLGRALKGPSKAAWQKGVYRRDFEHGIALVNPKGNGPVEITLETDFKRISGKQAPGVNSGKSARTIKLKDRDGIILMRLDSRSPPKPPQLSAN